MSNNEDWYKHTKCVLKIQYFITFTEKKTVLKNKKKRIKLKKYVRDILKSFVFIFTV